MKEGSYKATKGLIRIMAEVESGSLAEVQIAGDFFMYPEERLWELEHDLVGTRVQETEIVSKVRAFYRRTGVLTPGVVPEDFAKAIIRAVSGSAST